MRSSCSGHGYREGNIVLEDGRTLLVLDEKHSKLYREILDKLNIYEYIEKVGNPEDKDENPA